MGSTHFRFRRLGPWCRRTLLRANRVASTASISSSHMTQPLIGGLFWFSRKSALRITVPQSSHISSWILTSMLQGQHAQSSFRNQYKRTFNGIHEERYNVTLIAAEFPSRCRRCIQNQSARTWVDWFVRLRTRTHRISNHRVRTRGMKTVVTSHSYHLLCPGIHGNA